MDGGNFGARPNPAEPVSNWVFRVATAAARSFGVIATVTPVLPASPVPPAGSSSRSAAVIRWPAASTSARSARQALPTAVIRRRN